MTDTGPPIPPPPPPPPGGEGSWGQLPPAPPSYRSTPEPYPTGPPPYGAPVAPPVPAWTPPPIRWGMGDIFYGIGLWLLGGVIAAVVVIFGGAVDWDTGRIGELSIGAVALSLAAGWIGFVGWPVVATYVKGQHSLRKDFGLDIAWVDVGWGVLGGIGALAFSVAAGILWTVLTGQTSPSNDDFLPSKPGVLGTFVLWFLVAVCTPIAEELFFRGLTLRAIGRRWGLPAGIVLSSLVFGSFHITTFGLSGLFIVAVTATYGAVFALLVVRAGGRLGPSIIAHSVVNSTAILMTFVAGT